MSKVFVNVTQKAAMFFAAIIALALPASAQTWQSTGKSAVIPVVAVGTACNSSLDTVGITADRSTLLTCQSNVWRLLSSSASFGHFQFGAIYDRHDGSPQNFSSDSWYFDYGTSKGKTVIWTGNGIQRVPSIGHQSVFLGSVSKLKGVFVARIGYHHPSCASASSGFGPLFTGPVDIHIGKADPDLVAGGVMKISFNSTNVNKQVVADACYCGDTPDRLILQTGSGETSPIHYMACIKIFDGTLSY